MIAEIAIKNGFFSKRRKHSSMPIIERRRKNRLNEKSTWLQKHRRNIRSQFGEDGIIEQIFNVVGTKNLWAAEFGAWDGEYLSNTWNLLNNCRWSGLLIEGNSERALALAARYQPYGSRIATVSSPVGWTDADGFDAIAARTALPVEFDLLSIDIDGNDWHVWKAIQIYRPRVVVIEFNPTIANDIVFIQDAETNTHQGCSLLALIELGRSKDYELVATTDCNAIFVKKELFPLFGIEHNDVDSLHHVAYDIELFHGYDGTFYGAGHLNIVWHGISLAQEDFQILPSGMRRYPGA
jgi:hypothetical protein